MPIKVSQRLLKLIVLVFVSTLPALSFADTPQVAAGRFSTVGVKIDGTVVTVGDISLEVGTWTGITQVSSGEVITVTLWV